MNGGKWLFQSKYIRNEKAEFLKIILNNKSMFFFSSSMNRSSPISHVKSLSNDSLKSMITDLQYLG